MMKDIQQLYQDLLQPSDELVADVARLDGDILILGAGGKMGPSLSKLTRQAIAKAGVNKKVIAVSRFSEAGLQDQLNKEGIETISADLLEDAELQQLPDVKNVLYLAGTKFGTTGKESFTWAMNSYLPGRVAEKYKHSNIVVFSTGNIYPLTPVVMGGASETYPPEPMGEYAQSCLGRERIFQYSSSKYNTPILIYRLNYANDVTYGVLLEIAKSVKEGKPRVMGLVLTVDGLGEAFGPILAGGLRDRTGSYALGFTALIILSVIGTIAVAMLPRKQKYNDHLSDGRKFQPHHI